MVNDFFIKYKKIVIPLLSVIVATSVLVAGVIYTRYRQGLVKVGAANVLLQLVTASTTVKVGDEFNVDIYIDTKGMSVTGSDIKLKYDTNLFIAESVTQGNFLPVTFVPGQTASGIASIVLGCNPTTPKNGNGILATVKFKALRQGTSTTMSFDSATAVTALGQNVNVVGTLPNLTISIAVLPTVSPSPGPTKSPTPTPIPSRTPTARSTATANSTTSSPSPTSTRSPSPGPTKSPTPTPISTAHASSKPTGTVKAGDINGDGSVNIIDLGIIVDNYNKSVLTNSKADINGDSSVDIIDIGIVVDNYGK